MFVKIDIFDIDITEFRNPHSGGIDCPYDQFVTEIFNRVEQTQHLVMLQVFYLLLFYSRPVDPGQRI